MPGYDQSKDDLLTRLKRVEGQVRGLQRMVEGDQYCVDVLTQISAVTAALDRVGLRLLEDHVRGCVADALTSEDRTPKIEELVSVIQRFLKA